MKTIQVEIKGLTPLMMGNPASMLTADTSASSRLKKYVPEVEAEKLAYRNSKGLFVPSSAIFGCILNGSSFRKVGKYSARSILAGNIRIEPEEISLGVKDYTIDVRTVVVQTGKRKNRVIRARPRLDSWSLKFEIMYNEKYIMDSEIIKLCLEDAGSRVGLLEFRPQNSGSFGTFEVTKWTEK